MYVVVPPSDIVTMEGCCALNWHRSVDGCRVVAASTCLHHLKLTSKDKIVKPQSIYYLPSTYKVVASIATVGAKPVFTSFFEKNIINSVLRKVPGWVAMESVMNLIGWSCAKCRNPAKEEAVKQNLTCSIWLASKAVPGSSIMGVATRPASTQTMLGNSSSPKSGISFANSDQGFQITVREWNSVRHLFDVHRHRRIFGTGAQTQSV